MISFPFCVCIACICFKGKALENQRSRLSIFLFLSYTYIWIGNNPCKIFIYRFLVVWLLVFMCMTNRVEGAYEVVASERHAMKRRRS